VGNIEKGLLNQRGKKNKPVLIVLVIKTG